MSDITTIKRALAQHAPEIARMLLPAGKREGSEWRCGSVNGEPGSSLGVHLSGAKAGVWKDFGTDEGGDLLDLWCATCGINLLEAMDRAREYLNMEKPTFDRPAKQQFTRPKKPKCTKPLGKARAYLIHERKITEETLDKYKIAETTEQGGRCGLIVFPFLDKDGEPQLIKTRPIDSKECKPTSKNGKKTLMGWHTVEPNHRAVCITEGEYDALSLCDYGFTPALSVPFGGGGGAKQAWIENDYDLLDQFETIYLVLDNDGPGDEGAEEIASRLGRHRCKRVRLPRKDANACAQDSVSPELVAQAFVDASEMAPAGLRRPSDYYDAVLESFYPTDGHPPGYTLPYGNVGDKVVFRPGEVTVWSGGTGAGKSQILSDCSVDWIKQGSKICIASLEMHPKMQIKRMTKQAGNIDRPTADFLKECLSWLDGGIYLYDAMGKRSMSDLIEVFDYARARYGCDQFVIDSLMRLGIKGDDYNAQEQAMFELVNWALERDVHVHLVAHARKGEKGGSSLGTEDVKGAGEIANNAANVMLIWRNRTVEDSVAAEPDEAKKKALYDENAGVILFCAKQRNGEWEGKIRLWFTTKSFRYKGSPKGDFGRTYIPVVGRKEDAKISDNCANSLARG